MTKLDEAILFATKAHEGMRRKGFNQTFIFHPIEVLSLVEILTDDEDIKCAAVLHDTVEDANINIEEIRNKFGEKVASYVNFESENKRGNINKDATWLNRKEEAIEAIRNCNSIGAKMISLCDKLANLRSFHLMYLDKGEEMWKEFHMSDPLKHYWYYNSMKDAFEELKDTCIYKEYEFMINSIFSKYFKED